MTHKSGQLKMCLGCANERIHVRPQHTQSCAVTFLKSRGCVRDCCHRICCQLGLRKAHISKRIHRRRVCAVEADRGLQA